MDLALPFWGVPAVPRDRRAPAFSSDDAVLRDALRDGGAPADGNTAVVSRNIEALRLVAQSLASDISRTGASGDHASPRTVPRRASPARTAVPPEGPEATDEASKAEDRVKAMLAEDDAALERRVATDLVATLSRDGPRRAALDKEVAGGYVSNRDLIQDIMRRDGTEDIDDPTGQALRQVSPVHDIVEESTLAIVQRVRQHLTEALAEDSRVKTLEAQKDMWQHGDRDRILEAYRRAMAEEEEMRVQESKIDADVAERLARKNALQLVNTERRLELRQAIAKADNPKHQPYVFTLCDQLQQCEERLLATLLRNEALGERLRSVNADFQSLFSGVRSGSVGELRPLREELDFFSMEREWLYKRLELLQLKTKSGAALSGKRPTIVALESEADELHLKTVRGAREEISKARARTTRAKNQFDRMREHCARLESQLMRENERSQAAAQDLFDVRVKSIAARRRELGDDSDTPLMKAKELERQLQERKKFFLAQAAPLRVALQRVEEEKRSFVAEAVKLSHVSCTSEEVRAAFETFVDNGYGVVLQVVKDLTTSVVDDMANFLDDTLAQKWMRRNDPVIIALAQRRTLPTPVSLYTAAAEVLYGNWDMIARTFGQSARAMFENYGKESSVAKHRESAVADELVEAYAKLADATKYIAQLKQEYGVDEEATRNPVAELRERGMEARLRMLASRDKDNQATIQQLHRDVEAAQRASEESKGNVVQLEADLAARDATNLELTAEVASLVQQLEETRAATAHELAMVKEALTAKVPNRGSSRVPARQLRDADDREPVTSPRSPHSPALSPSLSETTLNSPEADAPLPSVDATRTRARRRVSSERTPARGRGKTENGGGGGVGAACGSKQRTHTTRKGKPESGAARVSASDINGSSAVLSQVASTVTRASEPNAGPASFVRAHNTDCERTVPDLSVPAALRARTDHSRTQQQSLDSSGFSDGALEATSPSRAADILPPAGPMSPNDSRTLSSPLGTSDPDHVPTTAVGGSSGAGNKPKSDGSSGENGSRSLGGRFSLDSPPRTAKRCITSATQTDALPEHMWSMSVPGRVGAGASPHSSAGRFDSIGNSSRPELPVPQSLVSAVGSEARTIGNTAAHRGQVSSSPRGHDGPVLVGPAPTQPAPPGLSCCDIEEHERYARGALAVWWAESALQLQRLVALWTNIQGPPDALESLLSSTGAVMPLSGLSFVNRSPRKRHETIGQKAPAVLPSGAVSSRRRRDVAVQVVVGASDAAPCALSRSPRDFMPHTDRALHGVAHEAPSGVFAEATAVVSTTMALAAVWDIEAAWRTAALLDATAFWDLAHRLQVILKAVAIQGPGKAPSSPRVAIVTQVGRSCGTSISVRPVLKRAAEDVPLEVQEALLPPASTPLAGLMGTDVLTEQDSPDLPDLPDLPQPSTSAPVNADVTGKLAAPTAVALGVASGTVPAHSVQLHQRRPVREQDTQTDAPRALERHEDPSPAQSPLHLRGLLPEHDGHIRGLAVALHNALVPIFDKVVSRMPWLPDELLHGDLFPFRAVQGTLGRRLRLPAGVALGADSCCRLMAFDIDACRLFATAFDDGVLQVQCQRDGPSSPTGHRGVASPQRAGPRSGSGPDEQLLHPSELRALVETQRREVNVSLLRPLADPTRGSPTPALESPHRGTTLPTADSQRVTPGRRGSTATLASAMLPVVASPAGAKRVLSRTTAPLPELSGTRTFSRRAVR